ncbi:hypothetical protein BBO99_00004279 [Phytophthora kernoviae]|uniref:WW domain-containing protein n=2 Tax=Phytophthora kernoviae TaxID=325452 RepID=A0A3R7KV14_9STRA|nr:hypothetical protein G195_005037 [Phytophthora kernoviae 00238/432]KAG2525645.1 hypothetical protein JM16_004272 [Phytophthora kernoviae]KAG2527372.1 hypothetical protein JM18_003636 [Phytophthora kernoviae]RLN21291.1 hypothetical protein BBI17_006688 [Phytophthora kernoviae]RLN80733.1 hypothetical protein BBO99_00004279 [Phytophthora kernoviae]
MNQEPGINCLQRAVGGGDNCFRVSGKLPKPLGEPNANGDLPKMRPLYLDTDSDDEAEKWMDAIRNHRFNLKKDEQFFEMVHHLHDAEYKVAQFEAAQKNEVDTKHTVRIKMQKLLHKMRALESDNADDYREDDIDENDDNFDMLSTVEAMEDVLMDLEAKTERQNQMITRLREFNAAKEKKLSAGTVSSRRGFTQVIQRAVSRYDSEQSEDEEESPPPRRRANKAQNHPPSTHDKGVSDVQAVCAMWNAKKKTPSQPPTVPEDGDSEEADTKNNKNRTAARHVTTAGNTGSKPQVSPSVQKFVAALQARPGKNDRESEEDTVSIGSSDDRGSGEETLPPGWTKHESRGFPGSYYYAHDTGVTSWEVPTEDTLRELGGSDAVDSNPLGGSPREKNPCDKNSHEIKHHDSNNRDNNPEHGTNARNNGARINDVRDNNSTRGNNVRYNARNNNAKRHATGTDDDIYVESSSDDLSELESDEDGGATSSAAYRVKKPKPKSAWAFKLPKLLPTTNNTQPPPEVASSLSPICHAADHHEF